MYVNVKVRNIIIFYFIGFIYYVIYLEIIVILFFFCSVRWKRYFLFDIDINDALTGTALRVKYLPPMPTTRNEFPFDRFMAACDVLDK